MQLEDLKSSIESMSIEELQAMLYDVRRERRMTTRMLKDVKKKKTGKTDFSMESLKKLLDDVGDLDKEEE